MPTLRNRYVAGMMQACQKESISGRWLTVGWAPCSWEMLTRRVGPIRRMKEYPAPMMMGRAILWRRVKRRGLGGTSVGAGVAVVLTSVTVVIVMGAPRCARLDGRGGRPHTETRTGRARWPPVPTDDFYRCTLPSLRGRRRSKF